MKVGVATRSGKNDKDIIEKLRAVGLEYVENDPEVILCYGGDGTFLIAERMYPGVPKLLVKNSRICNKCEKHTIEDALQMIRLNRFKVEDHPKIKAMIGERELLAVNDIVLRNKLPTHALRFELKVGEESYNEELIGDGIVVATPFGAGAYYYSVSKKSFNKGLGLAFNNMTKDLDHLNFEDTREVRVKITRGEAILVADNNTDGVELQEGAIVLIKKSEDFAKVIRLH